MTYRGHVKQGVIVLEPPAQLPEGTTVEVWASEAGPLDVISDNLDSQDEDAAIVAGSVAAVTALLPPEDFSDWEK